MLFDDRSDAGKLRMARRLTFAGAAPFALLALWLLWSAPGEPGWQGALDAIRAYAIAILSFTAGARWGAALGGEKAGRVFLYSVAPVIVAWLTVFAAPVLALAVLAMAFAAQGAWDVIAAQSGELPSWYGDLRMKATVIATGALIVAVLSLG